MSFPVYSVEIRRAPPVPYRRGSAGRDPYARNSRRRAWRRDPPEAERRTSACSVRIPVFRIVLRKERTIRVAQVSANSPERAARAAHALIGDSPFEKFLALLLDANANIVGAVIIATTSSISSAAFSVRGIFAPAIAHNASSIILAHNHPSGSTTPSSEDRAMASKANAAAEILGIPIVDNIIVTPDRDRWSRFC